MPLGFISRVSFGFGVIFGEKSQKGKTRKKKIWAKRVPTPQHREPTPRRGRGCQNGTPSGTPRCSFATPRHKHCSHRGNFQIFVSEHLIND